MAAVAMAKKKAAPAGGRADDREIVIVLKDSAEYRAWFDALSEQTLISGATIVRAALEDWAAARGLEPPPSPAVRKGGRPRKGDR